MKKSFDIATLTLVKEGLCFLEHREALPGPLAVPSALASGEGCLVIKGSRPPRAQHGALGLFGSLWYMRSLRNKHLSPLGHVCTRPCAGLEETEVLSSENLRSREGAMCVGAMQARSSSTRLPNLRQGAVHILQCRGRLARWSQAGGQSTSCGKVWASPGPLSAGTGARRDGGSQQGHLGAPWAELGCCMEVQISFCSAAAEVGSSAFKGYCGAVMLRLEVEGNPESLVWRRSWQTTGHKGCFQDGGPRGRE